MLFYFEGILLVKIYKLSYRVSLTKLVSKISLCKTIALTMVYRVHPNIMKNDRIGVKHKTYGKHLLFNIAGKAKNRKYTENELETGLLISIVLFFLYVYANNPKLN